MLSANDGYCVQLTNPIFVHIDTHHVNPFLSTWFDFNLIRITDKLLSKAWYEITYIFRNMNEFEPKHKHLHL